MTLKTIIVFSLSYVANFAGFIHGASLTSQNSQVGSKCPVAGGRSIGWNDGVTLLQRTVQEPETQEILEYLNKKRIRETFTSCAPLFTWDQSLAESAQQWADQCALVEYDQGRSDIPSKLFHDAWLRRSRVIQGKRKFAKEPGVAQTVHWARTMKQGLDIKVVGDLLDSDVAIEEGLIDGLFTSLGQDGDNILSWGHATHVGCGWIQFPTSTSEDEKKDRSFENFMVCNYGIGVPQNTTCDGSGGPGSEQPSYVTYYEAPFDVIADVKKCLKAVRCRRRNRGLSSGRDDPCEEDVETCLQGKSGLEFVKGATKLAGVGRSNDPLVAAEAPKCKIDTILCRLGDIANVNVNPKSIRVQSPYQDESNENATTLLDCKSRIRRCLPLIETDSGGKPNIQTQGNLLGSLPECQCAELTLSDGTEGDCQSDGGGWCFVKQSPCVAVDASGRIEKSEAYQPTNGLLHTSNAACLSINGLRKY